IVSSLEMLAEAAGRGAAGTAGGRLGAGDGGALGAEKLDLAGECSHDQYKIRLQLQGRGEQGEWGLLASAPDERDVPPATGLRRAATAELKRRGVNYFVLYDDDFGAEDFRNRLEEWGIEVAGEGSRARLYRIR
ncbi:MAG: hypothetical protein M1436_00890, partial [Acidobacteria bacterium]|nr:hypothetical protein [Acidobacteriota bacterium]